MVAMPKIPKNRRKKPRPRGDTGQKTKTTSKAAGSVCKPTRQGARGSVPAKRRKPLGVPLGATIGVGNSTAYCVACEGTGEDSTGWPCFLCSGTGKKKCRDGV